MTTPIQLTKAEADDVYQALLEARKSCVTAIRHWDRVLKRDPRNAVIPPLQDKRRRDLAALELLCERIGEAHHIGGY